MLPCFCLYPGKFSKWWTKSFPVVVLTLVVGNFSSSELIFLTPCEHTVKLGCLMLVVGNVASSRDEEWADLLFFFFSTIELVIFSPNWCHVPRDNLSDFTQLNPEPRNAFVHLFFHIRRTTSQDMQSLTFVHTLNHKYICSFFNPSLLFCVGVNGWQGRLICL